MPLKISVIKKVYSYFWFKNCLSSQVVPLRLYLKQRVREWRSGGSHFRFVRLVPGKVVGKKRAVTTKDSKVFSCGLIIMLKTGKLGIDIAKGKTRFTATKLQEGM